MYIKGSIGIDPVEFFISIIPLGQTHGAVQIIYEQPLISSIKNKQT